MPLGSGGAESEADWKYLCRPLDAETLRIIDHNGIKRGPSAPEHAEGVSWAYANLDSERNTYWYRPKIKAVCREYPFHLEGRIKPSKNSCLDLSQASLYKKEQDESIWEWDETVDGSPIYNAEVLGGGKCFGDKTVNTGGHGFRIKNTTGVNNVIGIWKHLNVDSINEDAYHVYAKPGQRMIIEDCWTSGLDNPPEGIGGYGLYLRSIADSIVTGGGVHGALGTFLDLLSDTPILGTYFGGQALNADYQLTMKGCKRVQLGGGFRCVDGVKGGINMIQSSVTTQCLLNEITDGWIMSDNLDAHDTYNAVQLEDSSHHNLLQNLAIGYKNVMPTEPPQQNRYHYGVVEIESCDWNEVGPNTYYEIENTDVVLVGVNSTDHQ